MTTLRIVSQTAEASTLRAALAAAEADRDHWHAVADERLRSLRVSRAVLQRVLMDAVATENATLYDSRKRDKLSLLGRLAHAGSVLAACGRSIVLYGDVVFGIAVGGVLWRLTHA